MSARCESAFHFVMNTQWRHFLETLDPGKPYLRSYPVLQTTFRSLCPSCLPRVPRLERTHFSHNPRVCLVTIALCPKKKAICSPGRMCVSHYRSRFLSWLLLLRQNLHLLILWLRSCWCQNLLESQFHRFSGSPQEPLGQVSGCLVRQSSAVPISTHLIPCQPPAEGAVNHRILTPFPNCLLFFKSCKG